MKIEEYIKLYKKRCIPSGATCAVPAVLKQGNNSIEFFIL